jgi:hypothetical protein
MSKRAHLQLDEGLARELEQLANEARKTDPMVSFSSVARAALRRGVEEMKLARARRAASEA